MQGYSSQRGRLCQRGVKQNMSLLGTAGIAQDLSGFQTSQRQARTREGRPRSRLTKP